MFPFITANRHKIQPRLGIIVTPQTNRTAMMNVRIVFHTAKRHIGTTARVAPTESLSSFITVGTGLAPVQLGFFKFRMGTRNVRSAGVVLSSRKIPASRSRLRGQKVRSARMVRKSAGSCLQRRPGAVGISGCVHAGRRGRPPCRRWVFRPRLYPWLPGPRLRIQIR